MTSETPLVDLIKIYKNNGDDGVLYQILEFIAGHLNYLNDCLSQTDNASRNDILLREMNAEISRLTKIKSEMAKAIWELWKNVSDDHKLSFKYFDPIAALGDITAWIKANKIKRISMRR